MRQRRGLRLADKRRRLSQDVLRAQQAMIRRKSSTWLTMTPQERLGCVIAHAATGEDWGQFARRYGVSEQGISRAAGILGVTGCDVVARAREAALVALADGIQRTTDGVAKDAGCTRTRAKHALQSLCAAGLVRQLVRKCEVSDVHKPWALYQITPAGLAQLKKAA